jgi:iron complex transport system substrate-binding protein
MTLLRRRGAALAAAILSAALVLTGCGSDGNDSGDTAGETRTVKADNGSIEVPTDPQRVVAIGNATLPFIDVGGKPVGVTFSPGTPTLETVPKEYRATFEAATDLGPSGSEVDLEKLASLKPDLILAVFLQDDFDQVGEQLQSIAPTVFYNNTTEWRTTAAGIAGASNEADALDDKVAEFEKRLTNIKQTYAEIIEDSTFVAVNRYASSEAGTIAIDSMGCEEILKEDVGLDLNNLSSAESLSFEQVGELSEYDVVLYPVDDEDQALEPFAPVVATNSWQALPAVKSGYALGVFCPTSLSYGGVAQYLDSFETALATLAAKE